MVVIAKFAKVFTHTVQIQIHVYISVRDAQYSDDWLFLPF